MSLLLSRFVVAGLSAVSSASTGGKLLVIGAGQGRTGTDSLRLALNELNVGPTYHMSQLLGIDASRPVSPLEMLGLVEGHSDIWTAIEANASQSLPLDWSFLLEDYQSSIDYPSTAYFTELLKANPSAKVILTVRDPAQVHRSSVDSWCRLIGVGSSVDWLVSAIYSLRPYGKRFFRMHDAMGRASGRKLGWDDFTFRRVCEDPAYGIAFFEAWDRMVRQSVPTGQLLVFETGRHGYKELAAFLGVKVPDTAYPRTNSKAEFTFVLNIMRTLAVLTVFLPGVLAWCMWRCCTRGPSEGKTKSN